MYCDRFSTALFQFQVYTVQMQILKCKNVIQFSQWMCYCCRVQSFYIYLNSRMWCWKCTQAFKSCSYSVNLPTEIHSLSQMLQKLSCSFISLILRTFSTIIGELKSYFICLKYLFESFRWKCATVSKKYVPFSAVVKDVKLTLREV